MVSEDVIRAQLPRTLERTHLPELGSKYEGKVRDCYVDGVSSALSRRWFLRMPSGSA